MIFVLFQNHLKPERISLGFIFLLDKILNRKEFRIWFKPPRVKPERVRGLVCPSRLKPEARKGFGFGLTPPFATRKGFGFGLNPPV